jgi:hypothetical protein
VLDEGNRDRYMGWLIKLTRHLKNNLRAIAVDLICALSVDHLHPGMLYYCCCFNLKRIAGRRDGTCIGQIPLVHFPYLTNTSVRARALTGLTVLLSPHQPLVCASIERTPPLHLLYFRKRANHFIAGE